MVKEEGILTALRRRNRRRRRSGGPHAARDLAEETLLSTRKAWRSSWPSPRSAIGGASWVMNTHMAVGSIIISSHCRIFYSTVLISSDWQTCDFYHRVDSYGGGQLLYYYIFTMCGIFYSTASLCSYWQTCDLFSTMLTHMVVGSIITCSHHQFYIIWSCDRFRLTYM